jgi:beta-lactamase superfamily II metal-dependent hydrolase
MHQASIPSDFEERRIYGFVEGTASPIPRNNYSRFALMLDAVDGAAFDDNPAASREPKHLSILRVISTPQRMLDLFSFEVPQEGSWIQLTLGTEPGLPPVWILSASNDFSGQVVRTNVISIELLRGVGANTNLRPRTVADDLEAWCAIKRPGRSTKLVKKIKPPTERFHIRIVDVGHASCAAIHTERNTNSPIVGYFDAGAPAFFHSKSFPALFNESARVPASGFVVLSHWDFDHYALAVTRLKNLQRLDWYAPRQKVGPNAAKFQDDLGARLHFIGRKQIPITKGLKLYRGLGPLTDRNSSGYVMRLKQKDENVLLTADVGYDHINTALKKGLTGLSVPHHGGNGSVNPPIGKGTAAVSYGLPNRYRHPVEDNLLAHAMAGWSIKRTAAHGPISRSDRWLTVA